MTDRIKLRNEREIDIMATIFDAAKYILDKIGPVSTWKLQKLCYYAQAWSIAWTEHPIFQEDFEAWANGPVCPALYRAHKGKYIVSADDIPSGNSANLTAEQKEDIDIVLKHYGPWDPYTLREQTHSENPWKQARGTVPEGKASNAVITRQSMGEYYGSL